MTNILSVPSSSTWSRAF